MSEHSHPERTNYPEGLEELMLSLDLFSHGTEGTNLLTSTQLNYAERFLHSVGVTFAFGARLRQGTARPQTPRQHIDRMCLDALEQDKTATVRPVILGVITTEAVFNPASTLTTRQKEDLLWKMRSMQKDVHHDTLQGDPARFVQWVEYLGNRMIHKIENQETQYPVLDEDVRESRQLLRQFILDDKWENGGFGITVVELAQRGFSSIRKRRGVSSPYDQ